MKVQTGKFKFFLLLFLLSGATGLMATAWVIGGQLISPAHHSPGHPTLPYQHTDVVIKSSSGSHIHGWLYHRNTAAPAVALFHGIRSHRGKMLQRANFLITNGYNVLLIDMQAHGESEGKHITFGFLESGDARAAIDFLRKKYPGRKVGAIGVSMGGAACLLGDHPVKVDALVLEAVYPNIIDAVKNRLEVKLGKVARVLSPLLTAQINWRLGIDVDKLSPELAIRQFRGALLLVAGSDDRRTPLPESYRLFNNANAPKSMWIVNKAGHTDYYRFATQQYQQRVKEFFDTHLRQKN